MLISPSSCSYRITSPSDDFAVLGLALAALDAPEVCACPQALSANTHSKHIAINATMRFACFETAECIIDTLSFFQNDRTPTLDSRPPASQAAHGAPAAPQPYRLKRLDRAVASSRLSNQVSRQIPGAHPSLVQWLLSLGVALPHQNHIILRVRPTNPVLSHYRLAKQRGASAV